MAQPYLLPTQLMLLCAYQWYASSPGQKFETLHPRWGVGVGNGIDMLLWPQRCGLCNRKCGKSPHFPHLAPRTGRWGIPLIGALWIVLKYVIDGVCPGIIIRLTTIYSYQTREPLGLAESNRCPLCQYCFNMHASIVCTYQWYASPSCSLANWWERWAKFSPRVGQLKIRLNVQVCEYVILTSLKLYI